MKAFRCMILGLGLSALGCGAAATGPATPESEQPAPETFTYSPMLDRPYRHQQRRYEEVSIPGSSMRNSEEWVIDWKVVVKQESNHFRHTMRLVGLRISVNGLALLKGDEIKESLAAIDLVTDKDSNVVDIRGTEQVSEALVGLAAPEAKEAMARMFSPENLKGLVLVRSRERTSDFVGKPTTVGSQWMANTPGAPGTRQIRVEREEPCGSQRCLRISRQYEVDRAAIQANVAKQVAAHVQAQGKDPGQVSVAGMEIKHEDSLLIDPRTMEFHDAKFEEGATLHVVTPDGNLQVAFKLERTSAYDYSATQ